MVQGDGRSEGEGPIKVGEALGTDEGSGMKLYLVEVELGLRLPRNLVPVFDIHRHTCKHYRASTEIYSYIYTHNHTELLRSTIGKNTYMLV